MYLDKPLRAHTLFQAITRTNRPGRTRRPGRRRPPGLVIDYIGLGTEIAKAVQIKRRERGREDRRRRPRHAAEGAARRTRDGARPLRRASTARARRSRALDGRAGAACRGGGARPVRARVPDRPRRCTSSSSRTPSSPRSERADYRWVAKVYQSSSRRSRPDALLWQRLGAKTHELIAQAHRRDRGRQGWPAHDRPRRASRSNS